MDIASRSDAVVPQTCILCIGQQGEFSICQKTCSCIELCGKTALDSLLHDLINTFLMSVEFIVEFIFKIIAIINVRNEGYSGYAY